MFFTWGPFEWALFPPLLLMLYIWRLDKQEPEPIGMIIKIFFFGCLSCLPAIVLELLGESVLDSFLSQDSDFILYNAINFFLIVALAEEYCKRFMFMHFMWKHPEFNYCFDAIVYCLASALGFAALENFFYLAGEGTDIVLWRLIPTHSICGILMGYFLGQAKLAEVTGKTAAMSTYKFLSLAMPVLIHGFYDFSLSSGSGELIILAFLMILFLTIFSFKLVHRSAKTDVPLSHL